MASLAAENGGGPGSVAYAAAKAGCSGFTKGLAKELARRRVTVNALAPGFIGDTPFHDTFTAGEARRAIVAGVPLGRAGTPGDVAGAVVSSPPTSPATSPVRSSTSTGVCSPDEPGRASAAPRGSHWPRRLVARLRVSHARSRTRSGDRTQVYPCRYGCGLRGAVRRSLARPPAPGRARRHARRAHPSGYARSGSGPPRRDPDPAGVRVALPRRARARAGTPAARPGCCGGSCSRRP